VLHLFPHEAGFTHCFSQIPDSERCLPSMRALESQVRDSGLLEVRHSDSTEYRDKPTNVHQALIEPRLRRPDDRMNKGCKEGGPRLR
jgi:hypothetical protein